MDRLRPAAKLSGAFQPLSLITPRRPSSLPRRSGIHRWPARARGGAVGLVGTLCRDLGAHSGCSCPSPCCPVERGGWPAEPAVRTLPVVPQRPPSPTATFLVRERRPVVEVVLEVEVLEPDLDTQVCRRISGAQKLADPLLGAADVAAAPRRRGCSARAPLVDYVWVAARRSRCRAPRRRRGTRCRDSVAQELVRGPTVGCCVADYSSFAAGEPRHMGLACAGTCPGFAMGTRQT